MLTDNIDIYIKDSLISGKVCRFNKKDIYIYISKISSQIQTYQKEEYYNIIKKAAFIWNSIINNAIGINFQFTDLPEKANIVILWTKTGIKFEGMCKYRSIIASEIKTVSIEIGLPNPNSPKNTDNNTILHTTLHELGHAMGLGHGINENDVMFLPHKKTLSYPGENDINVLKILYSNPIGTKFYNLKKIFK